MTSESILLILIQLDPQALKPRCITAWVFDTLNLEALILLPGQGNQTLNLRNQDHSGISDSQGVAIQPPRSDSPKQLNKHRCLDPVHATESASGACILHIDKAP